MRELFRKLNNAMNEGADSVLVTTVASSGSTPRGSGARMLITAEGRLAGTIGGGAVEYRSQQMAAEVLKNKCSFVESFRLQSGDVANLGMICGGAVDVYFRYISSEDKTVYRVTEKIEELYARGEQCWLICGLDEASGGKMAVYGKTSGLFGDTIPEEILEDLPPPPTQKQAKDGTYYTEELLKQGKVFIFGGGHVAQELVPALARVGFRCVVLEDRPDFARTELFHGVEETKIVDTANLGSLTDEISEDDYVCIMTRGHKDDFEIQRQILATPARYIGVIGSPAKKKAVFDRLRAFGYTDKDFERITAPIGLDIGGETPAEIAVSITAQLIMVRAGRAATSWGV